MKIYKPLLTIFACASVFYSGCGGNGGSGESNVSDISVEDSLILLGAQSVVRVPFSFDSGDVFDDDREVGLAVQLPSIVQFLASSAEIQRPIDDDDVEPAQILTCGDGSTILIFQFDESDLIGAENPGGDADAQVNFTIVAVQRGQGIIEARARTDSVNANCGTFTGDNSAAVVVQ